jgi:hypothetical protein
MLLKSVISGKVSWIVRVEEVSSEMKTHFLAFMYPIL